MKLVREYALKIIHDDDSSLEELEQRHIDTIMELLQTSHLLGKDTNLNRWTALRIVNALLSKGYLNHDIFRR